VTVTHHGSEQVGWAGEWSRVQKKHRAGSWPALSAYCVLPQRTANYFFFFAAFFFGAAFFAFFAAFFLVAIHPPVVGPSGNHEGHVGRVCVSGAVCIEQTLITKIVNFSNRAIPRRYFSSCPASGYPCAG
jgi:hypothetical protein